MEVVDTDSIQASVNSLESKMLSTNLFEASPSDGQGTKNFNPLLFEGSGGQETKDFNPKLLESSPADGEESKKLSINLVEVSPSDGQGTKDFNPKLLELSSSDGEGKKEEEKEEETCTGKTEDLWVFSRWSTVVVSSWWFIINQRKQ